MNETNNENFYIDDADIFPSDAIIEKSVQFIIDNNYRVILSESSIRRWCLDWQEFWRHTTHKDYLQSFDPKQKVRPKVRAKKQPLLNNNKWYLSWSDFQQFIEWMDKNEPRDQQDVKRHYQNLSQSVHKPEGEVGQTAQTRSETPPDNQGSELTILHSDIAMLRAANADLENELIDHKINSRAKTEILKKANDDLQTARDKNDELQRGLGEKNYIIKDLEEKLRKATQAAPQPDDNIKTAEVIKPGENETKDGKSFWPW